MGKKSRSTIHRSATIAVRSKERRNRTENIVISILSASDDELVRISSERVLSLSLGEMKAVKDHFTLQKRDPSRIELETIAQTWSEHCKHKTLRGVILMGDERIDNLLASTIIRSTKELNRDWCVSVFKDNAGIIRFDDRYDVAFKVETHNHPSALEPYGGAGTGIGGVIRDILGVGLGAYPVFNTDVFCFARPDYPKEQLPAGVFHPRRILKGVVSGVRDYGNRMGIPTISGALCFRDDFLCNPLVFCGTAGIIPRGMAEKTVKADDRIVVVGGRTGRDGIHGATFSSLELNAESDVSAVQIGNPIEEKKVTTALMKARDKGLYRSITDCGAGGFSSAVGEMAEGHGAEVWLDKVPLKYTGLKPWEIWISEAQERMVLAVPPEHLAECAEIFFAEDVEMSIIGKFNDSGKLTLLYDGTLEGELDLGFLHDGIPVFTCTGRFIEPDETDPALSQADSPADVLTAILARPDVASKEWIIRQYDHEVQGATVLKPLQGVRMDGPGDASAVRPIADSWKGLVVSHGINVHYGMIDPYWMAACAIEEALRNVVAVGGDIEHTCLLDNFCWGDPNDPDMIGGLVRACRACYDFSLVYRTPFVSGKDSLNNTFRDTLTGSLRSIPPTLLISALSVVGDIRKLISSDFKTAGQQIYAVGTTFRELGGSQYYQHRGVSGGRVPRVDGNRSYKTLSLISSLIKDGHITACHDCSDGGIAVTIAEMAFAGGLGAEISAAAIIRDPAVTRNDELLFSESQSRFVITVDPSKVKMVEERLSGIPWAHIGTVVTEQRLKIRGIDGNICIDEHIDDLRSAWQRPLGFL